MSCYHRRISIRVTETVLDFVQFVLVTKLAVDANHIIEANGDDERTREQGSALIINLETTITANRPM